MSHFEHGKTAFRWCDQCGTLILGKECSGCSSTGREFTVSNPGDIRPAMGKTNDLLASLFRRYFGTDKFLKGKTVFLNKTAGEDRTDEIIIQGRVIATLRYDLKKRDFVLDLKLDGARLLLTDATKGVVILAKDSGHLKGKTIPGSFVKEIRGEFQNGDPLIVTSGTMICSAVAKVNSQACLAAEKAIGIRDVGKGTLEVSNRKSSWTGFVNANKEYFKNLESNGVSDLKSFINNTDLPVTLSFSGGKDSLAAYGLLAKTGKKFSLMFVNTGLEFPETVSFVNAFAKSRHERLLIADAGNAFQEQIDNFGPPAKDFRWCCKVCKLAPLTSLIERNFPHGTVTVEGNRIFESFARSNLTFVAKNPFVPNQTILNPIRNWRAVDVWGYIWWKDLGYNPLYEEDFERIGCYLCPSCLESEWKNTSKIHPELHKAWNAYLLSWAGKDGENFIKYGFWRWKALPKKMIKIAEELKIKPPAMNAEALNLKWVKGVSPCVMGGYSAEGILTAPCEHGFAMTAEMLKTVGAVKYSPEYDIALVKVKGGTLKVFGGGQIVATAPTQAEAEKLFENGAKAVLRAQLCTDCGICVKNCPSRAIKFTNGHVEINDQRCTHCGKCAAACVVAHYYDKLVA
ncbi:phosphoadenosine phosphosulfate reductase domain-containing protein [Candidatus Methanomassiliicoccus intestinalis]|uniref:phosphoadenosine phosphosulfate reductase domain-containing protein n=1 Tax=Candidatus Methanomassiliicoccus intestinalis TaxID=1406512 RepID=UPI0037DD45B7